MAKTKTKSDKIRTLLDHGKSVAEIVKITKYSPSTVYGVRGKHRANQKVASGITTITSKSPVHQTGIAGLRAPRVSVPTAVAPTPKTFWQKVGDWFKNL